MCMGVRIIIVSNIESDILFEALLISPFAIAAEIVGTNAVENATLNDSGNVISVSTFPLSIPYCIVASLSVITFFKYLVTVIESTFLFNVDIIALSVIGSETNIIFFTILIGLSDLYLVCLSFACVLVFLLNL